MSYRKIWKKHALLREGKVYFVYLDSLDKLTGGIGHLLTKSEKKKYKLGDKISQEQIDIWFEKDSERATDKAIEQAQEIGIESDWFIASLISVNFQLGDFKKKFKGSYPAIVRGDYDHAIKNLRRSKWYRQTPVRVEDFIETLERAKSFEDRPVHKTRTVAGGSVAGTAIIASEVITDVTEKIEPLTGYSEVIQTVFIILALAGVALMIYARIDDRNKGHR